MQTAFGKETRIPSGIWSRLYGSFPSALNIYRASSQQCARGVTKYTWSKFDPESLYEPIKFETLQPYLVNKYIYHALRSRCMRAQALNYLLFSGCEGRVGPNPCPSLACSCESVHYFSISSRDPWQPAVQTCHRLTVECGLPTATSTKYLLLLQH